MDLGHGHRRSVFILWAWTALLSGFVLWPIYSRSGDGVVPFGISAILLSLYTILHPGLRPRRRRKVGADDATEETTDATGDPEVEPIEVGERPDRRVD